jgi:hypothetical protein
MEVLEKLWRQREQAVARGMHAHVDLTSCSLVRQTGGGRSIIGIKGNL